MSYQIVRRYCGMWRGMDMVAIRGCLCPDGKRRYVRITADADSYFSRPASVSVSVNGKRVTISGYVSGAHVLGDRIIDHGALSAEWMDSAEELVFHPVFYRPNSGLVPGFIHEGDYCQLPGKG